MTEIIRAATEADIPALHALIESAYRGESAKAGWTHEADLLGGQRTDAEALNEIICDPAQTMLLFQRDRETLGCVLVVDKGERDGHRTGYLGLLTVRPTLQNAGLGRLLIDAAEACARGFEADVMEMTVIDTRQELIDWYMRRGYAQTGRIAPFPNDPRFGLPKVDGLRFVILAKALR